MSTIEAGSGQQVIATYSDYEQAERAVDYLSDREFPVQHTVIVGRGLNMIEQITGRFTYWSAAGRGAVGGAVIGALFGWLFGLFGWVTPLIADLLLALYGAISGVILGAILGTVIGLIGHAMTGGRRDFSSAPQFRADSYQLLADTDIAGRAERMLNANTTPSGAGDDASDMNRTDTDMTDTESTGRTANRATEATDDRDLEEP